MSNPGPGDPSGSMPKAGGYVFEPHNDAAELERLHLLEQAHDPQSIRVLSPHVTAGATCLEIGPGAGSIARWMAERVDNVAADPKRPGAVIAMDADARHLHEEDGDTPVARAMRVIQADVVTQDLPPDTFDCAHARFVFLHVQAIEKGLLNMVRALKPGGVLALEEPDFTLSKLAEGSREDALAVDRVHQSIVALYSERGMRPYLGSLLPVILTRLGLEQIEVSTFAPLERGGDPVSRVMRKSVEFLRPALVETRVASDADVSRYLDLVSDPSVWFWHYATVSAVGRRPAAGGFTRLTDQFSSR